MTVVAVAAVVTAVQVGFCLSAPKDSCDSGNCVALVCRGLGAKTD
jgi:hypothetical protein